MTAITMPSRSPWFSFLSDEQTGAPRNPRATTLRAKARELDANESGAIMLMGLCMACFLIGSLWTIIGIGDAIVFRDLMQEAADHSAFTSAALHAKGMNFISACNLVMMALIFFHILFGIINDILFLACFIPWIDIVACPAFGYAHKVYVAYGNDIMKPAVTGIHYAEMVAGYGYPWLGAYKGYSVGSDYGNEFSAKKRDLMVFAVSPSLVPGTILDPLVNMLFKKDSTARRSTGQTNSEKLGLPVAPSPYSDVCKHIAQQGLDALLGFLNAPFLDYIKGALEDLIGVGVNFRYCNSLGYTGGGATDEANAGKPDVGNQVGKVNDQVDKVVNPKIADKNSKLPEGSTPAKSIGKIDMDTGGKGLAQLDPGLDQWWGKDGPYYPWNGTSNGAAWNQIWSLNMHPKFVDSQEHNVSIAQRKYGVTSTAKDAFGYFAEAEFYFDCDGMWGDAGCNGTNNNAGYSVQWRARLRRTELPNIMELLTSYGGDFLGNMGEVGQIFNKLRDKVLQFIPIPGLQNLLGPMTKTWKGQFQSWVEGEVKGGVDLGLSDGVYH